MTAARGAALAAAITALLTGASYAASAEMAGDPGLTPRGAFPGYALNREGMLRVIRNHRRAAHGESAGYEGLSIRAGRRSMPRTAPTRNWSRRRATAGTRRSHSANSTASATPRRR